MMNNKKRIRLFILLFLLIASTSTIARSQEVYYNAKVYTADKKNTDATAFVVMDGKFIYVGNDEQALKLGNGIDMKGLRIIPGMIDAHCHPILTASVNVTDVISFKEDMTAQHGVDTISKLAATNISLQCTIISKGTRKCLKL